MKRQCPPRTIRFLTRRVKSNRSALLVRYSEVTRPVLADVTGLVPMDAEQVKLGADKDPLPSAPP
mgnify:CR=1 FL=1